MADGFSIIDSHAHLDYPQFEGQIDEVLARAQALGVTEVISIGVKISTADKPRRLAESYENVWFSAGIHPHEAANEPDACNLDAIVAAADHPKCVAIGEAGLDYFYDNAPREVQEKLSCSDRRCPPNRKTYYVRAMQTKTSRNSETEMEKGAFTGVLHCFSSGK